MIPLDTDKWTYSKESNNLFHDIDHAGDVNPDVILNTIIPMYSTVPPNTEGEHRRNNVHMQTHVIALDLLVHWLLIKLSSKETLPL